LIHAPAKPPIWNLDLKFRLAKEISLGLAFLHSQQIIHRELKAVNVLLDSQFHAKLTDFGFASLRTETATKVPADSAVNSISWMAPELFSAKPKYSTASDMYAYGMTIWEMFFELSPFQETVNQSILQNAVKNGEREEIPENLPSNSPMPVATPNQVKEAITRCWSQTPTDRPTAEAVLQILLEGRGTADVVSPAALEIQV